MNEELKEFTKEDFLKNDFFIESHTSPSPVTDVFWSDLLKAGKINRRAYYDAKQFLINLEIEAQIEVDDKVKDRIWMKINKDVNSQTKWKLQPIRLITVASVAAILVLTFTLLTRNEDMLKVDSKKTVSLELIDRYKQSDEILLVLSDSDFHKAEDGAVVDYSSIKEVKVDNKSVAVQPSKIEYNHLIVPHGKRSSIILADGSKIWLNAGTHIVFPTSFGDDRREITVSGEIYANIAKDEKRPFKILSRDLTVEVLGTKFNLSSYEGEDFQSIVLVEGSVAVQSKENESTVLQPNQQYIQTQDTHKVESVDVSNHISWVEGYYSFQNEKFGVILRKLSVYYGVNITCDAEIYALQCTGGLDLKDNLQPVLLGLSQTTSTTFSYDEASKTYIYK